MYCFLGVLLEQAEANTTDRSEAKKKWLAAPSNFQSLTGRGVVCEVKGTAVRIGTRELMRSLGVALTPQVTLSDKRPPLPDVWYHVCRRYRSWL